MIPQAYRHKKYTLRSKTVTQSYLVLDYEFIQEDTTIMLNIIYTIKHNYPVTRIKALYHSGRVISAKEGNLSHEHLNTRFTKIDFSNVEHHFESIDAHKFARKI